MYRIIQWGTGNVGTHALRTIIDRPDFELAGVLVYNPDKVGVDAGTLIGGDATGVLATNDVDAIVATDADCVCYTALGGSLDGGAAALDDICRLLASGKNVVSSAVEYMAYLQPDAVLAGADPEAYARIDKATREGGSSFFHVGINPGYAMDIWPMQLTRLSRRIDKISVSEVVDMSGYSSINIVRDYIGFGVPPETETPLDLHFKNVYESPFYLAMLMLADSMNVELEDVLYRRDLAVTERDLELACGTIEAGTVAAMKLHIIGLVHGREAIDFEWVWRVSDEVGTDWHLGDSRWILRVEGDPTIDSEITLATTEDAGRAVSLAVATLLLNSVPTVCAAAPGMINNLNLAPHGGGYFLPE